MDKITQRKKEAVESILENESLTEDLDDQAAQLLINWGITCAEKSVLSSQMLDNETAEEMLTIKLRAVRRLMRLVNKWGIKLSEKNSQFNFEMFSQILGQAQIVYTDEFKVPDKFVQEAFLEKIIEPDFTMEQFIINLRRVIENQFNSI